MLGFFSYINWRSATLRVVECSKPSKELKWTHVLAAESVVVVTGNRRSEAILARRVAKLGVLSAVHLASCNLGIPLLLCGRQSMSVEVRVVQSVIPL